MRLKSKQTSWDPEQKTKLTCTQTHVQNNNKKKIKKCVFSCYICGNLLWNNKKKTGFFFIKNNTPGFEFGLENFIYCQIFLSTGYKP